MHIPDGFLDTRTAASTWALAILGVTAASRHASGRLARERVPLLGLAAAFVFAAQLINFPVLGGTSGHLIGGVLVASLLGPGAAVVVMASVLVLQCFVFGDGGVTALGANAVNMALVGTLSGWIAARGLARVLPGPAGRIGGVAFGSWLSVVLAAVSCSGQLAFSGRVAWHVVLPAMGFVHMLIGVGEALIASAVYAAVVRARPELGGEAELPGERPGFGGLVVAGLVAALALAAFVAPFACPWPDGLERVAETLGFGGSAKAPTFAVLLPDYSLPGVRVPVLATALAGALGTAGMFGLALLVGRVLARREGGATP